MGDPVLHLLAGPNGAGKSTLYAAVIGPVTHLEFVNADAIAAEHWPDNVAARAYDASRVAAERRRSLLDGRRSFVTETVFSHPSKVELVRSAVAAGYLVTLHVILVPEELAVARVRSRVAASGHAVPEEKIRGRYRRLWPLVVTAIGLADNSTVYDNSRAASPFRAVATFDRGALVDPADWPSWTPAPLRALGD